MIPITVRYTRSDIYLSVFLLCIPVWVERGGKVDLAMLDVKTLCLGVLYRGDATGYEIKKQFEDGPLGYFLDASYGAIYPALQRLSIEGLVACRDHRQQGRPDKKVYAITEAGRAAFRETLLKAPKEDKLRSEFLFVASFAQLLPPEHLARLIDQQIEQVKRKVDYLVDRMKSCETRGMRFAAGYGLALCRTAIDYLENERHILETRDEESRYADQEGEGSRHAAP